MSSPMYASRRFQYKKHLIAAVAAHNAGRGRAVRVEDFSLFSKGNPEEGTVSISGPSRHEMNRWYARVRLERGVIVKVVS